MPIEGSRARSASSYRAARRPEMIKLEKQRRRELLEKILKKRTGEPPKPERYSRTREAARRRRQIAAGQLQR